APPGWGSLRSVICNYRGIGLLCVAFAGAGCGGDDAGPVVDDVGDAGSSADAATGPMPCEMRCAAEQTPLSDGDECACSAAGVRVRLVSLGDGFYAQPWPLSSRLSEGGGLDLDGLPTAAAASFINDNLQLLATRTPGFSTSGAIMLALDGDLDPDTLPDADESLEDDASVYLVNVDPESDATGQRTPIDCRFSPQATDYHPEHFLSCAPFPGFPLRPDTLHALVVTDRVRDDAGQPLRRSQRWHDVLEGVNAGDDPLAAELIDVYAPLSDHLAGEGDALERVVGAAVFPTQDPTADLAAIAAQIGAMDAPTPDTVGDLLDPLPAESGSYTALEGSYATPIYQQGMTPYGSSGGDILFGDDGEPLVATTLDLRFVLTIPDGPAPDAGYPVVLYHHGTGGDAASFVRDGTAEQLAGVGVAAIGIDAPVHGQRRPAGTDPTLLFFNIGNVLALRDNIRQGAVDLLVLERFVEAFDLPAGTSPTGEAIRFDPDAIFAMGHSQGGLTLPLMLPFAEHVRGAMLSGAGASITASILYKTSPVDIPTLARGLLGLAPDEPLDPFHPVLALVQAFSDSADAVNYAPYYYRWPGARGLDLWATQGLLDRDAPPEVTDALVTAIGLSPVRPTPRPVEGLILRGVEALDYPASGNLEADDGTFTAVYSQYPDDGHFLIFDNPDAEAQLRHFFETLANDGRAELIAP
ncbi:MAG: alpha/beta hydrolase, partial [Myxococcales bacterium]